MILFLLFYRGTTTPESGVGKPALERGRYSVGLPVNFSSQKPCLSTVVSCPGKFKHIFKGYK